MSRFTAVTFARLLRIILKYKKAAHWIVRSSPAAPYAKLLMLTEIEEG